MQKMIQTGRKPIPIQAMLAIGIGCAVTLAVYGYQFGRSNHSVYLLDAMRQNDPSLLANDWFATSTLQYHVIFTHFSAALLRAGVIEPVFACAYALLVLLFHVAWRGIVHRLNGDDERYVLSVVLYHLCAAGTGLGMYQFFQDSSLLPSNLANVALLWGIWMWIADRPIAAGACMGIAGVFHLNHAVIGVAMWSVLSLVEWKKANRRDLILGGLLAIVPSLINIGLAMGMKLTRSGAMPLGEFVELYVRLRHPHHYDPSSWPTGIWLAILLPTAAGLMLLRERARGIFLFMLMLNLVALIGAGIWYFSETLVQMSLYRFSIYVQLLGCIAGAIGIGVTLKNPRHIGASACIGCIAIIGVCLIRGPFFGVFRMNEDDPSYRALCRWIEQNTPDDAILLVPPAEESMRLLGRRAIVVNFKGVPQLSAELAEWRKRLCDVLSIDDPTVLPRGFGETMRAMRVRYNAMTPLQLEFAATKYGARFIVTEQLLDAPYFQLLYHDPARRWFLYSVGA